MPWRRSHRETSTGQPGTDVINCSGLVLCTQHSSRDTCGELLTASWLDDEGVYKCCASYAVCASQCHALRVTRAELTRRGQHPPEARQDGHASGKGECVRY